MVLWCLRCNGIFLYDGHSPLWNTKTCHSCGGFLKMQMSICHSEFHQKIQMAQVGSKHYYIFEPTTLKRRVWDHVLGKHTKVLIPVFFYMYNDELYAKCINPKIQWQTRFNPKGFSMFIPGNISYHSSKLISISIKEFQFNYLQMKLDDGSPYSQGCNNQLIGKCLIK